MTLVLFFVVGLIGLYALFKTNHWADAGTNPLRWALTAMVALSAAAAFFHHIGY